MSAGKIRLYIFLIYFGFGFCLIYPLLKFLQESFTLNFKKEVTIM